MKKKIAVVAAGCVAVLAAVAVMSCSKAPEPQAPQHEPALSGWVPTSLDPKRAGKGTWTVEVPYDNDLPTEPVKEPHIVLTFGYPVTIHTLKLSSGQGGTFKAWATLVDDAGREEVVPVGEGAGPGVEMVIPWRHARKRIVALRISYQAAGPRYEPILELEPRKIAREMGKAYQYRLAQPVGESDTVDQPMRSTLLVMENGALLGTPHSLHDQIRKLGGGRYSHWGDAILFSTLDDSDPRTNGRTYAIGRVGPKEVRVEVR